MLSGTNSYAFCADYSNIAACLFAIQTSEENGAFAADAQLLKMLRLFEKDVVRKLYLRTLRTLKSLDVIGVPTRTFVSGDFTNKDFSGKDFFTGYWILNPQEADPGSDFIMGDFEDEDFIFLDFYVGFLDTRNTSYSSAFQTILNIFAEFCSRSEELSEDDKAALDEVLIPVLDAFEDLQAYLIKAGLNPCIAPEQEFLSNTPGVYLQAAGSDGTDGIAEGIHLRWSFTGELSLNHLPKGDYSNNSTSPTGFNRPNDYIQISRAKYINPVRFALDFEQNKPVVDFLKRKWTYTINQTVNGQKISNRIRLTFLDTALYDQLAVSVSPSVNFFNFIQQYNGRIELNVINKPMFLGGFDFRRSNEAENTVLKIEGTCQHDAGTEPVLIRKTVELDNGLSIETEISGDNITAFKIKKYSSGYLHGFYFETYADFLITRSAEDWTAVGSGFALSLADEQVFDRLENQNYLVDNRWPQYNNGTRVRISNYKDKWTTSHPNEPSLQKVVTTYLELSETDPRAEDVIKDDNADDDFPGLLISYLDILNLQSMDYHMARMLGLGFIDTPADTEVTDQFIYRLSYVNRAGLDSNKIINYFYYSLPVSKTKNLLPEKPVIRPVTYTLPVNDQQVNTLFDEKGYTKIDSIRIVNIGRQLFDDEVADYDFFASSTIGNSNVFEHPKPVLYGVEYRPESQIDYVKPEITNEKSMGTVYNAYDSDFPAAGIPETVPVPDNETSLYIHFERQTGVHLYAIYGVNWFDRASVISDEVTTDATVFVPKNSLTPPTDVAVHYIQREETLVFTTSTEQYWLAGRSEAFPGKEVGFTRVTFSWIDIQDISNLQNPSAEDLAAMPRADTMKAFFKPEMPLEITGVIRDLVPVIGSESQLLLLTGSYFTIDGSIISPAINPADFNRFKDSLLSATDGQYRVIEIIAGTDWPVITIEKSLEISAIDDENAPGTYGAQKTYTLPNIGSRFSMIENLSEEANWEPVTKDIALISFADVNNPVIESSVDAEGNVSKYLIGGITDQAIVNKLFDVWDIGGELQGYYQITFNSVNVLPAHPQINYPFDPSSPDRNSPSESHKAHVEWYKGWIRMPLQTDPSEKKMLQVVWVDISNGHLILYVHDSSYMDLQIDYSTSEQDMKVVNLHPGYKVYFYNEPAQAFSEDNIFPSVDASNKTTLFGLQAADTRIEGNSYVSKVSMPAVLLARRIEEPVQFDAPEAIMLKVRPDAIGKAAFTFDMRIKPAEDGTPRKPFGFTFYRTTGEDVIQALYAPETANQIYGDLASLTEDPFYSQRFYELINLMFDPENRGQFKVFDAIPQAYGFPAPDKPELADGDETIELGHYHNAIIGTLLPLTEQMPVYSFIKEGIQTENKLPVIRDIDGNLLTAEDQAFNPFPMVRKYIKDLDVNATRIRFTDYFLSGSSRSLYFYAGTEMTNQLIPGLLSPFTGPVTILHTAPSSALIIRAVSLLPASVATDQPSVTFQIAPISIEDHISLIRIYRTTDALKAGILQMADNWFDIDIEEGITAGYEITDSFTDNSAPVGQKIYYTLVGVRIIINELEEPEEVLSEVSAIITVNLIDTTNPQAPDLIYTPESNRLSWEPTTYNGTYYLFQQNSRGNWGRIYTVEPPDTANTMEYTLPQPLVFEDEEGNRIYNRFKVQAQNSSGLLNLAEKELTI